ncbi:hypothetical protein EMIHUDRAFT_204067 [Emiliania huxleyi CCMP1516]|uniref:URB1 C-terminal domain-containing protein n=2 Tax=Emiliania huxleyi TaxID=2903 RepID=A0A0D3J8G7_EMIH1|nr:hypothetical protein EMIHUDRAFT_242558 [Emiliania huxleyi CCMP1516]XP_005781837.1 hypothetical protein EMIHUDRAFT_204067 [Emiliania huxleyi CCMP1516]EOD19802.1 hypothetical protein EMIHUDRAFT_242558 [Emiliania huxleyi CCMP1516]EOD29408.1 hypothetical protein EMIHUDRAFT_204067 [Emiliania huxleyi CCMP1516]|eukprot:XP_005772231.1 hypothetical protein EMIHUDRAFT_242558 [Emiliania huxleyi CCMP1516]
MLLPAEPAGCGGEPLSASAPLEGGEAARASTRRRRRCGLERRLFTCLSREQVARADAAEGPRPDALGSLLVLRCLLRHGRCDAPRWISKGAAGLLVVGLSAASPSARSLAYEAVAALMAERPHVVRLLRSLQDAITKPNLRVPSLWSVFVAHGLAILAQPHHPQYKALNNYILTRAFFDLSDVALFFRCSTPECELRTTSHRLQVPMFFHCFHSGSSTPRDDRLWMLALLSHGLRAEEDARLCGGRHVLELLLGLSDSRGSATRASALLSKHGILAWLRMQLCASPLSSPLLELVALLAALVREMEEEAAAWRFFCESVRLLSEACRQPGAATLAAALERARAAGSLVAWLEKRLAASVPLRLSAPAAALGSLCGFYGFQLESGRALPVPALACREWLRESRHLTHRLNRALLLLSAPRLTPAERDAAAELVATAAGSVPGAARGACAEELLSLLLRGNHVGSSGLGALDALRALSTHQCPAMFPGAGDLE